MLFNSKHDQCRAFFEFRYFLLISSTTPAKILKLSHIVVQLTYFLTCFSSCTVDDKCIKVRYLWQNEGGIVEPEDERSSSEPEDNQAQVGHEILCESIIIKVFSSSLEF